MLFRNMSIHAHPWTIVVSALLLSLSPAFAQVFIVAPGAPPAVVVTADEPSRMAAYAAEEFIEHVERATGVRLSVVTESEATAGDASRVFIGVTAASAAAGLETDGMRDDAFFLRVVGDDLFVLGLERDNEDPMSEAAASGTLYGVYELLERFVGVRWMWPGELGTVVPHHEALRIDDGLDEFHEPKTRFRTFRWHHIQNAATNYDERIGRLAFSPEGIQAYRDDLGVFLRRNRIGHTEQKPPTTHHFSGWWQRYGKEHPDWFMMREDGGRGPGPEPEEQIPDWRLNHVAMNVANPDLHRFIVEEDWDGGSHIRLGEVDVRVFCQSPESKAWDVEASEGYYPDLYRMGWDGEWNEPAPYDDYLPQAVSDRYARFWKTIYDLAVERNPDVVVTTYLYWNYFPAPLGDIQLNENIYGEFVQWTRVTKWMPMPDEAYAWIKDQWLGWQRTGISMAYRPNYFHGGYVMPQVDTWQSGEFIRFAYEHGMVGTDFDTLHGHWAVRGPQFYIHFRLFWNPELTVEELRKEYFDAFGPASELVEQYFDYWEAHAHSVMTPLEPWPDSGLWSPARAHITYPAESFVEPAAMLEEALAATSEEAHAERVRFLQAGLEHARLASRFMESLVRGRAPVFDAERFAAAQQAMAELAEFRRAHEHLYISDYIFASSREHQYCQIDLLMQEAAEVLVPSLDGQWGSWEFRPDPEDAGHDAAWFAADAGTDDWESIESPAHWPEDYTGHGWYKVGFTVPEEWEGRPVTLLFEGVSEQAWVFVNGEFQREHTMESETMPPSMLRTWPFTVVLTPEQVNYGEENTLVLRVHADAFGGGITGLISGFTLRDDDPAWRATQEEVRVGG